MEHTVEEKAFTGILIYVKRKTGKTSATKFEAAETKRSTQYGHIRICLHALHFN
jgi:hypothetical protein